MKIKDSVTGIILAGGKSKRMGSDKGLVIFDGKPLVEYSISLLRHFCSRIIISSSNPEYQRFGFELIADEIAGAGPMAGIASCLKASRTDLNLVLSCDMPLLEPVVMETLLGNVPGHTFVVPVDMEGRAEPLCAVYHKNCIDILENLMNRKAYRLTELFLLAPVIFIKPSDFPVEYNNRWFANFNSMDDMQKVWHTDPS